MPKYSQTISGYFWAVCGVVSNESGMPMAVTAVGAELAVAQKERLQHLQTRRYRAADILHGVQGVKKNTFSTSAQ